MEGCVGGAFWGAGVAGSGNGVGCTGAGAGAPPSSTERGAALCADITARISEMNRKRPAHHQVTLVSNVVACRPPMNCSVPAPPPSDASPPPWPACSNTAVVRIRASRVRTMRDVWLHQDIKASGSEYGVTVPSHGTLLLRVK